MSYGNLNSAAFLWQNSLRDLSRGKMEKENGIKWFKRLPETVLLPEQLTVSNCLCIKRLSPL